MTGKDSGDLQFLYILRPFLIRVRIKLKDLQVSRRHFEYREVLERLYNNTRRTHVPLKGLLRKERLSDEMNEI